MSILRSALRRLPSAGSDVFRRDVASGREIRFPNRILRISDMTSLPKMRFSNRKRRISVEYPINKPATVAIFAFYSTVYLLCSFLFGN